MAIKKYSKKKHGDKYISKSKPTLRVKELASKDGADTIYYDSNLKKYLKRAVMLLEQVYGYKDIKIIVSRGYSTPSHNKKIGGASKSLHVYKGSAIDHKYTGIKNGKRVIIPSDIVCGCYQIADAPGIEMIDNYYVHIDTRCGRSGTWKAKKEGNSYPKVSSFLNKNNPRPKMKYKGKKYEIYGNRTIGNKYKLKINGKLKWVKVAK